MRVVEKLSRTKNNGLETSQAIAGRLLGLDWGLRALVRMPEP
jgi:hypothetical protein